MLQEQKKVFFLLRNDWDSSDIAGIFFSKEDAEKELLKINKIKENNKINAEKYGLYSYQGEDSYFSIEEKKIGLDQKLIPKASNPFPIKEIFSGIMGIIGTINYSNSIETKKFFSKQFKDMKFRKALHIADKPIEKYSTYTITLEIEKQYWYISENRKASTTYHNFKPFNIYNNEKDFVMVYLIDEFSGIFIKRSQNVFNVISFINKKEPINGILSNVKLKNCNIKLLVTSNNFEEAFEIANKFIKKE